MRSCRLPLSLSLVVLATPALLRAQPSEFADRVGTLQLDAEIDARGSLGGITVDQLGFLYVANFRDGVWRIDPETGRTEVLSRSLYGASGNAFDSQGNLYQASFLGNTITRIARDGTWYYVSKARTIGAASSHRWQPGFVTNSRKRRFALKV